MTISLPNIHKYSGHVVQGLVTKFDVWEDSQIKEEGMDIKSKP